MCLYSKAQYIDEYPSNKLNASKVMELKNYQVAVRIYSELLKEEPNNIDFQFQLGTAYTYSNINQRRGLDLLKQVDASANKPDGVSKILAIAYFKNYEFDNAISTFNKVKNTLTNPEEIKEIDDWITQCNNSIQLKKRPISVRFENLGKDVNSDAPDYLPLVSPDESVIMFSTRRDGVVGNLFDYGGYKTADIYTSKHRRGKYSRSRSIGSPNTYGNEETAGSSENGDYMLYHVDSEDNYSDLYVSEMGRRSYMPPKELNSDLVNQKTSEPGGSLTNEGDQLFFCSNRDGGFGGFDIYSVKRLPNGDWAEPINLGNEINTAKDEKYPLIRTNGNELYFSSNGFPGMGGMDLYKSILVDGKWSKPANLGYPLNTVNDDNNISFAENSRYAYVAARMDDSFGDLDIYRVVFEDKREELALVSGNLIRSDSSLILEEIVIEILNPETGELFGSYLSNSKTGKYVAILPPGVYSLEIINAQNFEDKVKKIIIKDKNDFVSVMNLNIVLNEKPKKITPIKNVESTIKTTPVEKK